MDRASEKVKYWYVIPMALTGALGFIILGFWFGYFNTFTKVMHRKYLMSDSDFFIQDESFFNSFVSGLVPIGAIFGALIIGPVVSTGRRRTLILISLVFTWATAITLIFNFWWLVFGRLIMGTWVGSYATVAPLFISEIAPVSISGPLGVMNQFMAVIGMTCAYSLPFILPYPDEPDALTNDKWRIIFGFPMIVTLTQCFLLVFIFKFDTPKFYKTNNDIANYTEIMSRIYEIEEDSHQGLTDLDQKKIEESPEAQQNEVSYSDMFSSRYRKALFVGLWLSAFHQLTGFNGVVFNSNEMFTQGKSGISADKAARIGTFFMGISGLAGTVTSLLFSKCLGRKMIILIGEIEMMINLALLGLCTINSWTVLMIVFTNAFVFTYNATLGPVFWLYASEILPSKGMSMAVFVNMIMTAVFGTFTHQLCSILTDPGFYFTLSAFQIVWFFFVLFLVLETKGKPKSDLESLYSILVPKMSVYTELQGITS